MSVTTEYQKTPVYTENYRGFAVELHPAGQEWYAKTTSPVQWITSTRRTWVAALFALYQMVDRYEAARAFCRLTLAEQPAVGAVELVGRYVPVGAAAEEPSATWAVRS